MLPRRAMNLYLVERVLSIHTIKAAMGVATTTRFSSLSDPKNAISLKLQFQLHKATRGGEQRSGK